MPNWVKNIMVSRDLKSIMAEDGRAMFSQEDGAEVVDFNRILPRPKELSDVSSPPDLRPVLCYFTDGFKKDLDEDVFEKVASITGDYSGLPEDMQEVYEEGRQGRIDPNEPVFLGLPIPEDAKKVPLKEKGRIYAVNAEKYGAPTWYEWDMMNWGCQWNAMDSEWLESSDHESVFFLTAWNEPSGFYRALAEKYPELNASVICADENYAFGCAYIRIKDGELFSYYFSPFGSIGAFLCSIACDGFDPQYDEYYFNGEAGKSFSHMSADDVFRYFEENLEMINEDNQKKLCF